MKSFLRTNFKRKGKAMGNKNMYSFQPVSDKVYYNGISTS